MLVLAHRHLGQSKPLCSGQLRRPGDNVQFRSRTYNRPDLVPVAKVLEFAEQRDYRAVLGYCALSDTNKERVKLGLEPTYRFDVEMLAGRWQVVGFSAH